MNIAIIFAGGQGTRLNNQTNALPKQFLEIDGKPILIHTLLKFQNHPEIDKIYISIIKEYEEFTQKLIQEFNITKVKGITIGGSSAQESIYNALELAHKENDDNSIVLIHDGVRPIITDKVISDNIQSVKNFGTAITATPSYETIIITKDSIMPDYVPIRKETYKAQAPQSFRLKAILDAHQKIQSTQNKYNNIVDSCTLFEKLGHKTHLVEGNFGNIKVTTPEDVYILKGILNWQKDNEE